MKHEQTDLERRLQEEAAKEASEAQDELQSTEMEPDAPVDDAEKSPEERIEELEKKCEELKDQWLRSRADFENYRKRMVRETERIRKTAAENLIRELLPVLDNLELALKHAEGASHPMYDGVKMVHKLLLEKLQQSGVSPIPAMGMKFDPQVHEAISQIVSDEHEPHSVAEEFQKGYLLGDQVLRPSKVVVATPPLTEEEKGKHGRK